MALSSQFYTGDGATLSFPITFNFLLDSHIKVFIDSTEQFSPADFSYVAPNIIFVSAPASGTTVKLIRNTPKTLAGRMVDFANASIISESDLDTSAIQLLYLVQEAFETDATGGVGSDIDVLSFSTALSGYDSGLKRIVRLADPTLIDDAVNKRYIDGNYLPLVSLEWDAGSKKIVNISTPTLSGDAATKNYVDSVANFGVGGVPELFTFDTVVSQSTYVLTGLTDVEQNMVVLYNKTTNKLLTPGVDFSIVAGNPDSTLTLLPTPTGIESYSLQNFAKKLFVAADGLLPGSVTAIKLATDAVETLKIKDGNVTLNKMAPNSVDGNKIVSGSISNTNLGLNSVHSGNILDGNVIDGKLSAGSVNYSDIKTTGFATAPATATDQFIAIDKTTGNQSKKQLATGDITDFNSSLAATPINTLASAIGQVSMGALGSENKIINLAEPGANTDAATKGYVDSAIVGGLNSRGPWLLIDEVLSSSRNDWDLAWGQTGFIRYEIIITNLFGALGADTIQLLAQDEATGIFDPVPWKNLAVTQQPVSPQHFAFEVIKESPSRFILFHKDGTNNSPSAAHSGISGIRLHSLLSKQIFVGARALIYGFSSL